MPPANIFRREALEHQQEHWLGAVRLIRPVSLHVLTAFVVLAALAVAGFLAFGEYTRKARVSGVLVPRGGIVNLRAPQEATVLEQRFAEGAQVRRGDVLFVLSLDRGSSLGDTQAAVQRSLGERQRSLQDTSSQQAALVREQQADLDRRISDMQHARAQFAIRADLQRERLQLAEQALAQFESLQGENFMSPAQVRAKKQDVLEQRERLQALATERAAHERELAALQTRLRELPLQARGRQGEIDRSLFDVTEKVAESEARRQLLLRAPNDGVLSAVMAEPGQAVSPETVLASVVPAHAPLLAYLYAPSSAIGFVRPEQTVLLRYQAFPYQKFGHQSGKVLQVSRTPLPAAEPSAQPMYRITVALDRQSVTAYGQAQPLSAGMQLDADVLLDRRRLVEWIFEPLLGIAGRV
jgi:membrane fusion protein